MATNTILKLKRQPNIAGNLHYLCQNHGDHLYIEEAEIKEKLSEDQIKEKYPDEFEIPYDQFLKYFNCISHSERTEQDFKEDEEHYKWSKEEDRKNKEIEKDLRKHGEECLQFKHFMEYAYKSYSIKNGIIDLRPFLRKFEVCPFCHEDFDGL